MKNETAVRGAQAVDLLFAVLTKFSRSKLWVAMAGMGLIAFAGPLGIPAAALPYIATVATGYIAAEGIADIRSRGKQKPSAGEKGAPK